ncbi:MAG: hypothetical protein K8U57_36130 [Planctomycetes bacterium]|nr:hypothetical protein [Planctomycetota bacterium]
MISSFRDSKLLHCVFREGREVVDGFGVPGDSLPVRFDDRMTHRTPHAKVAVEQCHQGLLQKVAVPISRLGFHGFSFGLMTISCRSPSTE